MKKKSFLYNIFFIGIFLSSLIYSPFILDFTLTPRLIFISLVLVILLYQWFQSNKGKLIKIDFILLSYAVYVFFSCLSCLWANTLTEAIFENSKLLMSLGIFLCSYYVFKSDKEYALITFCKISIVVVFIELVLVSFQLCQLTVFNKEALYNVYGANSHKNLVSSFIYINLFFLIVGLFKMQKWWKWLNVLALFFALAIIAVIQTKAVWIALIVSVFLWFILFLFKKSRISLNVKWSLIIGVILIDVFFIFLQPKIIEKGLTFNIEQNKNEQVSQKKELDNERLQLWDKTYSMIKENPLIGVGAGNWQIYFPKATLKGMYRAEDLNFTFQRPHNDILWIIAETGFIGFNLFLVFTLSILLFLVKTIKTATDKQTSLYLSLGLVVIIGFFIASFFDFPKERIEHLIWINSVFGFMYYLIQENNSIKTIIEFKFTKIHFLIFELCLVMLVLVGIYRYKGEFFTRKMYDQKRLNNNIGVIKEAKKAINFVYSIDPTSLPIKWYTGNSYAILGNLVQAKSDFKNAYLLNPYNRNVINDLASAYVNTNHLDSAAYFYEEACRISPRFDDPKLNLVAIYFNQKDFKKADSCLQTLLHDSERRTKYQTIVNAYLDKK